MALAVCVRSLALHAWLIMPYLAPWVGPGCAEKKLMRNGGVGEDVSLCRRFVVIRLDCTWQLRRRTILSERGGEW
ncbi:uncharacterized protein B0H64DRAFT_379211 [Chaetomium fimeti]|uniref:Secreted protein n=1 Tax=Chaetomium fimeti TaxID=1854472 RepID=A0AAE0HNG5_9PEZI|nr:hypothetical protein B0H64DRAFT_379211 [Chaetomium fimeti]